jgi:hypothetical protein
VPEWAKIMTLIIALGAWLAVVVAHLAQGKLPDAVLMGIPAALIVALAPTSITTRRVRRNRTRPAVDVSAADEDEGA